MTHVALINQLEVKAGRRTQFDNRGQVKGEDHCIFDSRELFAGTLGDSRYLILSAGTFLPILHGDEGKADVLTAAGEAETVNGKDGVNVVFLFGQIVLAYFVQNLLGSLLGSAGR